jgi:hypothetical protein
VESYRSRAIRVPVKYLTFLGVLLYQGCLAEDESPSWVMVEYEETLRVGAVDDSLYALEPIPDMTVSRDGRILALQGISGSVIEFDSTGAFRTRFSRRGAGPGELLAPVALGFSGDTLWVFDQTTRRVTYFDENGHTLRSDRPPEIPPTGDGSRISALLPLSGGMSLGIFVIPYTVIEAGLVRTRPLVVFRPDGIPPDTIAVLPILETESYPVPTDRGTVYVTNPVREYPSSAQPRRDLGSVSYSATPRWFSKDMCGSSCSLLRAIPLPT